MRRLGGVRDHVGPLLEQEGSEALAIEHLLAKEDEDRPVGVVQRDVDVVGAGARAAQA